MYLTCTSGPAFLPLSRVSKARSRTIALTPGSPPEKMRVIHSCSTATLASSEPPSTTTALTVLHQKVIKLKAPSNL
jgi:hypothetical protein